MCSNDESIFHADDTILVYVGASLEELIDHVVSRLRNILDWFNCNKLTMTCLKSVFMILTSNRIQIHPHLINSAVLIIEVKSFKCHGIYSDTPQKYAAKIYCLKSKLSKLCEVSFRLSKF